VTSRLFIGLVTCNANLSTNVENLINIMPYGRNYVFILDEMALVLRNDPDTDRWYIFNVLCKIKMLQFGERMFQFIDLVNTRHVGFVLYLFQHLCNL